MKKKIRITEGQIRRAVNESVKHLLSELDWKTYHDAGSFAGYRHDINRAKKFNDKAWDELEKKFFPKGEDSYDRYEYRMRGNALSQEFNDYDNDNYEYVKGKGWQLKNESYSRRGRMINEDEGEIGMNGFYPYGVIRFVQDIDEDDLYDDSYIDWAEDPNSFEDIDWDRFDLTEDGIYALTEDGQREIENNNQVGRMNDYQRQHSFGFGKHLDEYELFEKIINEPLFAVKIR